MPPEMTAALDAAAAAEDDKPSRSELIRRIVTEWLKAKGMLG
ncbi:MAG TPA: ribbon-helix-helix protein, CopG family [Enterovirga sp.]|nr:ribbon-helix-helix protein, CopG family [Enterovirga sp.]